MPANAPSQLLHEYGDPDSCFLEMKKKKRKKSREDILYYWRMLIGYKVKMEMRPSPSLSRGLNYYGDGWLFIYHFCFIQFSMKERLFYN